MNKIIKTTLAISGLVGAIAWAQTSTSNSTTRGAATREATSQPNNSGQMSESDSVNAPGTGAIATPRMTPGTSPTPGMTPPGSY